MPALSKWWNTRSLVNLSDEEVHTLARGGSEPALEHLLERYRGLVEFKARCYFLSGGEHEDVLQEGMIGLYKAIRDYRSDRFARFRAFAEICVTRQIISAVKSASRQKHHPLNRYVPLNRPVGDEDLYLVDLLCGARDNEPESTCISRQLAEMLDRGAALSLSELERQVIRRRLEGKTYEQTAAELRCGEKSVDNALQRAKRKISSAIGAWQS
jgi:RNA polymerase sporulation-specific sigma factor